MHKAGCESGHHEGLGDLSAGACYPTPVRRIFRPAPAAFHRQGVPPTILVVDDEPKVCQVTCRMLQEAGYATEGVYSARAAAFSRPIACTTYSCPTSVYRTCPA